MIKSTEVYGNGVEGDVRILAEGEYRGLWYVAVSYISHPCCYVEFPKDCYDYSPEYNIRCNGGITYHEVGLPRLIEGLHDPESTYVGWDYAHLFDAYWMPEFNRFSKNSMGKIYTSEELEYDCKNVIDQIVEKRRDEEEEEDD